MITDFLNDPPEAISQCLGCAKPDCINCLSGGKSCAKRRPEKSVTAKFTEAVIAGCSDWKLAEMFDLELNAVARRRLYHERKLIGRTA